MKKFKFKAKVFTVLVKPHLEKPRDKLCKKCFKQSHGGTAKFVTTS